MNNIWAVLQQGVAAALVALFLLLLQRIFLDKLSPRWQYAVWAVLALRILLPAYTGKYYVLLPLPLWVETAKVMVEPHWASAYTNVYEATQVTSPIPWLTGAPVSLSDWLFLLYVVGVVVTLLWYLISWLRLCLLLRQGTPVPADVQEQIERIGKGAKLVRREYPTAIGPVDIMAIDGNGEHVAIEIKRNGGIDGVEQLTRYCDLLNRDPLLAPVHGIFAAQTITPQARVLAQDRGFKCLILDYEEMKGTEDDSLRLF